MTQILVESASVVMILLLLSRFPSSQLLRSEEKREAKGRIFRVVLSGGVGLVMTCLVLFADRHSHPDPIGPKYLELSEPLAEGTNAVNTILVDFRGFDTLGEITVLLIATLGALGLMMRYKRAARATMPSQPQGSFWKRNASDESDHRFLSRARPHRACVPAGKHCLGVSPAARAQPAGRWLHRRAHDGMSFILLGLVRGWEELQRELPVPPLRLASFGLLLAMITGTAPMLFGRQFLTQYQLHLDYVPLIGEVHIGTPLLFDVGVFLLVSCITVKLVIVLARSTSGLPAFTPGRFHITHRNLRPPSRRRQQGGAPCKLRPPFSSVCSLRCRSTCSCTRALFASSLGL